MADGCFCTARFRICGKRISECWGGGGRAEKRRGDGALEEAIAQAGGCAAMVRSEVEWQELEQAKAVAAAPLIEITRIGDAPPEKPRHPQKPSGREQPRSAYADPRVWADAQ